MIDEKLLSKAAEIINNSNHIVFFTGAGISTESGIDDFRSEGGLWSRYDPAIYASYFYFLQDPSKFWEMHNEIEDIVANAEPNPAHYAIAELERIGKVKAIITQNIDMLHQRAGSGAYNDIPIYELHGAYGRLECVKCRKEFEYNEIDTKSVKYPVCECSGFIKPKVVLFGESLPTNILDMAMKSCRDCDCFIMVGSSLLISPANYMPNFAKQNSAKIIFINKERTIMDNLADVFLQGSAGEIFIKLMKIIKKY